MNLNQIKGGWNQFRGSVKTKLSMFVRHKPTTIAQQREQLIDYFQQRYGYEKEQAESALDKELSCSH